MVKYTKNDLIDVDGYGAALNRRGYILFDRGTAEIDAEYMRSQSETLANDAKFIMKLRSGCRYYALSKESVLGYLKNTEGCPSHYFSTRKTQGESLDMKKVLGKLRSNGKAVEFLDSYMAHRSMKSKHDSFRKLIEGCNRYVADDVNGAKLYAIPFNANVQKNLRFNFRSYDIISQIPKESCSTIAAEDGYFLAWGDFAQSDFRIAYNLFMRSEENDKIMLKYEDKYEALARIMKKTLNQDFDLEEFKAQRKLYKQLVLATIYGTRGSVVPEEDRFIKAFSLYLSKCPRYTEYYKRLLGHLEMRSTLRLLSYFGGEEFIYFDKMSDKNSVLYDALNSPVQKGTSEIVIRTVMSILEMARAAGYDEDQFSLYFTRHDEPLFRIRMDAIDSLWILNQHSEILVDDWSPLALDFDFGYHYKIHDDDLMMQAQACYERHKDEIDTFEPSRQSDVTYFPIKPLLNMCVHWIPLNDKTIVTFYEPASDRATFSIFDTVNQDEIIKNIRIRVRDCEQKIAKRYTNVLLRSNFYDNEDYFRDTHVVYRYEEGTGMTRVVQLCKGITYMYCLQNGIEPPFSGGQPLQQFPEKLVELITSEEISDGEG